MLNLNVITQAGYTADIPSKVATQISNTKEATMKDNLFITDEVSGNVAATSIPFTLTKGEPTMDTTIAPDPGVPKINEMTEIIDERRFYKKDVEAIAERFIAEYGMIERYRLFHYFDGHLHFYNGRCYEKLTKKNLQRLRELIRKFAKTLKLTDERGKRVLTPTTKKFYNDIIEAIQMLCELSEEEAEKFKTLPENLVFGKTKIWDMVTGRFHEYNPSYFNTFTLDCDVAENDDEPEVWKEFFDAAGMGLDQRRSWWYQRSVILMQDRKHNRLFFNFGNIRSGKGTTSAIDIAFFGKGNTATIPRKLGKHSTASLIGKPLLIISDMKFDRHINNDFIQLLLNLVGEDFVPVEPKYKEAIDAMLEGNLVISSNELPNFRGNLSGLERKFVFNVFYRTQDVAPNLKERMLATMPQIIRKAAKIYPEVVASGYNFDTEQGLAMGRQLLEASSVVGCFIEEKCVLGEGHIIRTVDLFNDFKNYAKDRNEHIPSISLFEAEIFASYLGQITKDRIRDHEMGTRFTYFIGVSLAPPPPRPKPPEDVVPF